MTALADGVIRAVLTPALAVAALVLGASPAGAEDPPRSAQFQVSQAAPQGRAKAAPQQQPAQKAQPPGAGEAAGGDIEAQIGELRRRLSITPAQQAQFDSFAQAMRQNAQDTEKLAQQEQQNTKHDAVSALEASIRFAEAETEGLKRLQPPLQALYASLSDQQKKTADQLLGNNPEPEPPPPPSKRR